MKFFKYILLFFGILVFNGCSNNTNNIPQQNNYPFNSDSHYKTELDVIRREKYRKIKLINNKEKEILDILDKLIDKSKYSIYLQTSYGAFLGHSDKEMFLRMNSKRADFLIVNKYGYPELVIEYSGEGHYQNNSSIRDDIKELACQSADLPFVKITFKENLHEAIQKKVLTIL